MGIDDNANEDVWQDALFEVPEEAPQKGAISIVTATFEGAQQTTWEELFEGFDELYAITFSSGIDFMSGVISKFGYAEIIFGHEGVLDSDISIAMSVSKQMVEELARHKSAKVLAERMQASTLSCYVARDSKSHEKIYCLKARDGRCRVIVGSANLSKRAFTGLQRENIVVFNSAEAYDYYRGLFEDYKKECADEVVHTLLGRVAKKEDYLEEHPEEIPVYRTLDKKRTIILSPTTEEAASDIQFIANVKNVSADIKPIMPAMKKQGGAIVLNTDQLREVKKKITDVFTEKKARRQVFPRLFVDYENGRLYFNDKEITLSPAKEDVARDVACVTGYLDSLSRFGTEWRAAQENYFKFMNWFFASVFMAKLRLTASSNGYTTTLFPVVGILYGESNGGKSTFVKLLMKLMTGNEIQPCSNNDFAATRIDKLKQVCQGVPIYIDDLARMQYQNHNEKVIKDDNWGIEQRLINYPAVAFSTNKLPSVTPDIYKRSVTCRINVRISVEDGVNSSKQVNESIKKASTALFGEYVARMLPVVAKMEEDMKADRDNPDLFRESSKVLVEIMTEVMGDALPAYITELNYGKYFGSEEIGREAKRKILAAWESEPGAFTVKKRKDKLVYEFPDSARFDVKYLMDELPPNLNCQMSARTLTMTYSEAKDFFGVNFKRSPFSRK